MPEKDKKTYKILSALATTGIVALIDEATMYQEHRQDDSLKQLFKDMLPPSLLDAAKIFDAKYCHVLLEFNDRIFKHANEKTTATDILLNCSDQFIIAFTRELIERFKVNTPVKKLIIETLLTISDTVEDFEAYADKVLD